MPFARQSSRRSDEEARGGGEQSQASSSRLFVPAGHDNAYLPGQSWNEIPQVENSYLRQTCHTSELLRDSSTGLSGKASHSTFPNTKEINRMAGTILVAPTNTRSSSIAKATIKRAPPGIRLRTRIVGPRVTTACPWQTQTPLTTSRRLCGSAAPPMI
jgi:hypothetical protein